MRKMRILHVIENTNPASGGPSHSVTNLVDNLIENDVDAFLLSQNFGNSNFITLKRNPKNHFLLNVKSKIVMWSGYSAYLFIRRNSFDIIHIHGLWSPFCFWIAYYSIRNKTPFVISPRGMLLKNALRLKYLKKKIAMVLYQKHIINHSKAVIVTSKEEALSVINCGFQDKDIFIVPNGVDLPKTVKEWNCKNNEILFLSRLHKIKGLDNLLFAWSKLKFKNGWKLMIAGSGSSDYEKGIVKKINDYKINDSVELLGHLDGFSKENAFERAKFFILPSYSENFGNAILEALSFGLPVITTKNTPWKIIQDFSCGWYIDNDPDAIIKALNQAIKIKKEEWIYMSNASKEIVDPFDWSVISTEVKNIYAKI